MYNDNKRLALSVFWVILGAALIILTLTDVLGDTIYAGMGGALMAIGILQVIRRVKYKKDPEYREKIDTETSDERLSFIRLKSWGWTGYIVILVEGVGVIISMIVGNALVQQVLSYSVCLILVIYCISYFVLSRKY